MGDQLDRSKIVQLSPINAKVFEIYQLSKRVDVPGFFEFAYNAHFPRTDPLEMQYFCKAFVKVDELYKHFQKLRAEKEQYYRKLKNGPNA